MTVIPGYTLLRPLGRGGMGEVHLARQHSLDREVALKLLAPSLAADERAREHFLREARIAASLQHPCIVPIHDVGTCDAIAYIAMEYLPGGAIAPPAGGRVEPAIALRVARDIAGALEHAHARGVVHRDVKPENILLRGDGSCVLSDFGIARASGHSTLLTREGLCIGTPQYMSPEQLRGQDVDGRADLYSLGVVLFRLLTGALPFEASDGWALGMLHLTEPVPRLPRELFALQPLLDDLLAKERHARPASAAELARRIEALQGVPGPSPQAFASQLPAPADAPVPTHTMQLTAVVRACEPAPPASIAVLPFADLSPGRDHAYLADGIAEEILDALGRVRDLRVAGRASSFHFRDGDRHPKAVGEALGVAHLLDGSVRMQGRRVRITVRLLRATDGFQAWSESFDGAMDDVFALQERIARAIAARLDASLHGAASLLVPVATASPDAYLLYLQASAIFTRRDSARVADAMALLAQALEHDPGFARAHARLAALHVMAFEYGVRDAHASLAVAERHALRAIELDAGFAEPHAVLGQLYRLQRRFLDGRAAFERALALEPDDPGVLHARGMSLLFTGYRREGLAALDRVLELDPLLPIALLWRGSAHASDGRFDEAERMLRRANAFGLLPIGFGMAWVEEMRGRRDRAFDHLVGGLRVFLSAFPAGSAETVAAACLGDREAAAAARRLFDDYLAGRPRVLSAIVPWALLRMQEPTLALELLAKGPTSNDGLVFAVLFTAIGSAARAHPAFAGFVEQTGLAELWRRHGPPDFRAPEQA